MSGKRLTARSRNFLNTYSSILDSAWAGTDPDGPLPPFLENQAVRYAAHFLELVGYIDGQKPQFVFGKVQKMLNEVVKPLRGPHVHVVGVAAENDIDDTCESPAPDVISLL